MLVYQRVSGHSDFKFHLHLCLSVSKIMSKQLGSRPSKVPLPSRSRISKSWAALSLSRFFWIKEVTGPAGPDHFSSYGYGSLPIDTFLVGWTSIYQLFWCSPGVRGFDTLPYQGFHKWHPNSWMVYNGKSQTNSWMITRATPILGNLHMMNLVF